MEVLRDPAFWTGVSVGVGSCAALGILVVFRPMLPFRLFGSNVIKFGESARVVRYGEA